MNIKQFTEAVRAHYSGDEEAFDAVFKGVLTGLSPAQRDMLVRMAERAKLEANKRTVRAAPINVYRSEFGSLVDTAESTGVSLSDLFLDDNVKSTIDSIVREHAARDRLVAAGLRPTSRVFLYGPSGTGKTSIAKALATAIGLPFSIVRIPQLIDSYVGETEKNIDRLLSVASQRPCVLCLDEIDAIGKSRGGDKSGAGRHGNSVVNTLLFELDRREGSDGMIVATTNMLDVVDDAIVRRFDVSVSIGMCGASEAANYAMSLIDKYDVAFVAKTDESQTEYSKEERDKITRWFDSMVATRGVSDVSGILFIASGVYSLGKVKSVVMRAIRRAVIDESSIYGATLSFELSSLAV